MAHKNPVVGNGQLFDEPGFHQVDLGPVQLVIIVARGKPAGLFGEPLPHGALVKMQIQVQHRHIVAGLDPFGGKMMQRQHPVLQVLAVAHHVAKGYQ